MSTFSYLCLLQALNQHLQICQKLQRFSQHFLITWSWSWVRLSLSAAVVSSVTLSVINRAAQVEVIISSIISDKWGPERSSCYQNRVRCYIAQICDDEEEGEKYLDDDSSKMIWSKWMLGWPTHCRPMCCDFSSKMILVFATAFIHFFVSLVWLFHSLLAMVYRISHGYICHFL